jgi:hypothetical protein
MRLNKYVSALAMVAIMLVPLVSCQSSTSAIVSKTVSVPIELINEAIRECEGKTMWGISFPIVRTNYFPGFVIEAAFVLHNGNDVARLVTIDCSPTFVSSTDDEFQVTYEPTPTQACEWLKPETNSLRLAKMETKVLKIMLHVPEGITQLPVRWEVDLAANGTPIQVYDQIVTVTSKDIVDKVTGEVTPDTTLTIHLTHPLLEGVQSVLSIKSTIDEQPFVTSYDAESGMLTIGGLKSNAVRDITISYEMQMAMTTAYNQRWLITMIKQ